MNTDDYVLSSSHGYAQKGDQFSGVKSSDYSSIDRWHYGDQVAYLGRELQNDPARRYVDTISISRQHQIDMHDHMDQASLLRQQQLLKAQSLQFGSDMSFEHEYVELEKNGEDKALVSAGELSRMKHANTVWNAKVILMSGMSTDALNEMCSYKSSNEKIIHINNILRFAVLKMDRFFMAIGRAWNAAIDGGDPSVEDSSLIQTARRYLKDIIQLDLQNCQRWNHFLEIHYDRTGEDGLFSHKEITVLFVPDLSECLPSLDTWRTQWLARKKDVAERERQLAAKDKRSTEKKESGQEKDKAEGSAGKCVKVAKTGSDVPIPKKEVKADYTKDAIKESNKKYAVGQKGKGHLLDEKSMEDNVEGAGEEGNGKKVADKANADLTLDKKKAVKKKIVNKVVKGKVAKKATEATVEDGGNGKKVTDKANADLTLDKKKAVKKKIVNKVVKGKAAKKATKATVDDGAAKLNDKVDVKDEGDKQSKQENVVKEEDSADPANVKTFARKKIVKKVPAGKSAQKVVNAVDSSANQSEKTTDSEMESREKTTKKEPDETPTPQETRVKTARKKKIIRRVIKRKVSGTKEKNVTAVKDEAGNEDDTVAPQKASKGEETKEQVGRKDEEIVGTSNSKDKMMSEESKTLAAEKNRATEKKEKTEKEKRVSKGSAEPEVAKNKYSKKVDHGSKNERTKVEKENKSKDAKHDPKQKSPKEVKEKGKSEEPPQHPGLFLQTKRSKGSKIRSMALSLDGLLDYNDKDIEESTFELSVFAESLNELLQYQMGCRLLSFLEKLRRRYVMKKNQRKRQRDEKSEKENEESSSLKRTKVTDESGVQNESPKPGEKDTPDQSHDETMDEGGSAAEQDESKIENNGVDDNDIVKDEENNSDDDNQNDNGDDEEEDPEEIIEDDHEMDDVAPSDGVQEDENAAKKAEA